MMIKCSTKGNPPIWGLAISLFLAGCVGFSGFDEIDQSELQREAVWPDSAITPSYCPIVAQGYEGVTVLPEIGKGQACGARAPLEVTMLQGQDPVTFSTDAIINCVMLSQLDRFFAERVQPLARDAFGEPVTTVRVAASYSCRSRNNQRGAKLSEHGLANALDISALTLADGTVLTIEDDWRRRGKKGRFLRNFNREACKYFTTVIGPGGDDFHQDHIHLDHGKHGRKGTWRVCQ